MDCIRKSILLLIATMTIAALAACSKTSVTGVWKKSDYTGQPFRSIMVVGLTGEPNNKLLWENIMADRLRQHGLSAVPTTISAFPDDRQVDEKEIIEYVKGKGIEAVLVTRLVDTKKEEVYHPPQGAYYGGAYGYYSHFNNYYPRAYRTVYTPGYTATYTTVLLETNLYRADTQELIWSMSSDTFEPRSINQLVDSVSKKVLAMLAKDKLI